MLRHVIRGVVQVPSRAVRKAEAVVGADYLSAVGPRVTAAPTSTQHAPTEAQSGTTHWGWGGGISILEASQLFMP